MAQLLEGYHLLQSQQAKGLREGGLPFERPHHQGQGEPFACPGAQPG